MNTSTYILGMAIVSLIIGLGLYIWLVRSNASFFNSTNVVSWLLIALFPVLVIFSFFPGNSISGTLLGFSMSGAIAAFIFIWWYGTRTAKDAAEIDKRIEEMRTDHLAQLQVREEELQYLKELKEENKGTKLPSVLQEHEIILYKLREKRSRQIGLITGDIRQVKEADIWVNSENTNMLMARYFERSISGIIRYLGARKDGAGNVTEDIVANELTGKMHEFNALTVQPATVIVTEAGNLHETNNVKKIFHVASVQGELGFGHRPINNIEYCISNSLQRADAQDLASSGLKSILYPLMGTGTAKGDRKEIVRRLLQAAISYMETAENSAIEKIFFLTWTDVELEMCQAFLEESDKLVFSGRT